MDTLDIVFIVVIAVIGGTAVTLWVTLGKAEMTIAGLRKNVSDLEKEIESLKGSVEELKEVSFALRNPVDRPLLLAGFDPLEIHILKVSLGELNIPFAPVYRILAEQHPELWEKYQHYLKAGGAPVEVLWAKYRQESDSGSNDLTRIST